MANITSIMNKVARNAQVLGLTVVSQTPNTVLIQDGAATLLVGYQLAQIQVPMGGVDPTISPYLGIGIANPGKLTLVSSNSGGSVADVIDSAVAAQVLQMLSGFANDIILGDQTNPEICQLRGSVDALMLGQ